VPILPQIIVASDFDTLTRQVAEDFMEASQVAIAERGAFNVALAGGSTPRPLYQALAGLEMSEKIDWGAVRVFFGDERCVSPDHVDSNYHMACESLLCHVPIPPAQIHRMPAEQDDSEAAAAEYGRVLAEYLERDDNGVPPFDLVLLGVGADGHVASLFPGGCALDVSDRWVAADRAPGGQGLMRLTITLPVIRASQHVWFLCRGVEKAETLATVAGEIAVSETRTLPAANAYPRKGEWRWYLDEPAASKIACEFPGARQLGERSESAS
jgi:6-phosphogluconolactonase